MTRRFIALLLLMTSITLVAEARTKYKIKKDTIPLRDTKKSLLVNLEGKDIAWVSMAIINNKLNLFYGTEGNDSNIYNTTTDSKFKYVYNDTIKNLKWFKSTENSSITPILHKGKHKFPLFIYSHKSPFNNSIYDKYLELNNSSKSMRRYFVPNNKVVKIVATKSGFIRTFYTDNRFDKGVIMCISSNDFGATWSYPEISISDNIVSFENCSMAIDRTGLLYAILTDKEHRAFLCKSENHGRTWSHPEELSSKLLGSEHCITLNRSGVYILFRSHHKGPTFGDYIVWNGNINELNNGAHNGQKVVVMGSSAVRSHNVKKMKIEHFKGNKYVIYGLMEQDSSHIINTYLFKGRFYL